MRPAPFGVRSYGAEGGCEGSRIIALKVWLRPIRRSVAKAIRRIVTGEKGGGNRLPAEVANAISRTAKAIRSRTSELSARRVATNRVREVDLKANAGNSRYRIPAMAIGRR